MTTPMVGLSWRNLDLWINGLALLSVCCLAGPAFHANRYGRLVARLTTNRPRFKDGADHRIRADAIRRLRHLQGDWTAWKGTLLLIGTALAGLSSGLAVMRALVAGAS
jgi:hypothetical protein